MPWWNVALRLTGLGWYIAVCIVAGILGGFWLDRAIGSTPIFILIGTVLGSVVAFWGVYKMIVPVLYGSEDQSKKGRRE